MIIGYSIIAVSTGILSVEIGRSSVRRVFAKKCPQCGTDDHDPDAAHCNPCGKILS